MLSPQDRRGSLNSQFERFVEIKGRIILPESVIAETSQYAARPGLVQSSLVCRTHLEIEYCEVVQEDLDLLHLTPAGIKEFNPLSPGHTRSNLLLFL